MQDEDFQPLLKILEFCQPLIEHESQIYSFAKCCFVLLSRDKKFSTTANFIVVKLCQEMWHKIVDGALRVCTTNNKNSVENHILLQILMHFQKFPSLHSKLKTAFEGVVEEFGVEQPIEEVIDEENYGFGVEKWLEEVDEEINDR